MNKFGSLEDEGGIIESYSITRSSDTADLKDKDGKLKTKAFFAWKWEATANVITAGTAPKQGDIITLDGKSFTIMSVTKTGSNSEFVKHSIKATLYGETSGLTVNKD